MIDCVPAKLESTENMFSIVCHSRQEIDCDIVHSLMLQMHCTLLLPIQISHFSMLKFEVALIAQGKTVYLVYVP